MRNQRNKKVNEFEEERNLRVLQDKMREQRISYVKYKKQYYEELERILACAYFQDRSFNLYENKVLEKYYKQYIESYLLYLSYREKLNNYSHLIKWLRCTA